MAKVSKITIKYNNGILPDNLAELLANADEQDLRILVAAMMLADRESGEASIGSLAELVGVAQSEVDASVKFWRGAGVITACASRAPSVQKPKAEPTEATETTKQKETRVETAHRNGAVERSASLTAYSSAELADLMERRRVSAQFIDEAQRVLGRIFRQYDTGILVGIVDQLGFEEEATLAFLAYAVKRGKKTLRYAEQMAMAFYDDGVTDTQAVLERLGRMERSGEVISRIRTMFGIGGRDLTATEKKLFTAWIERYAYDLDVIRMAYDITVNSIQKPVPKYTNSILEKWYTEGLRTVADVEAYLEKGRSDRSAIDGGAKSYDTEEYVEAALLRTFEHLS